ncbi:MAG: ATP-binding cassette domain-containing protein, partial [Lachnospiraceae bacterium]|nr:ATP-binding cassette domain-containing protein [Lachnospiraceae bacterium]
MSNTKQKSILHYIFKYAGAYKGRYFISIAFALLGVCFSMIPFMLMGKLVANLVKGNRDFQYYRSLAIAMAVMWVLRVICHTISTDISHMATFKVLASVRKALCDKLSRMSLGTVLDTPSGAMKNIIVERVDTMETTLAHMVPEFTSNLTAPIVMYIYIWILDWRTLSIPERSTVAFVGPSGGGKTTLCHLIARFWDVDKGKVTLDNRDVKSYSMNSLMSNYSFVFQNVFLFHDTIANNIRFGRPDASMDEVISAATKACCHDFIMALPEGYETVIGENGASLSGGERQRISIARAIMKDAPIIILAEATANVDPENEKDLIEAI